MVRPTKKKQISNLPEVIKDTAWKRIAETGAAALSLRAIARDLQITSPAIYNYFSRRDDLVRYQPLKQVGFLDHPALPGCRSKLRSYRLSPGAKASVEMMYEFTEPFLVNSSKFEKIFQINASPIMDGITHTVNWFRKNQNR